MNDEQNNTVKKIKCPQCGHLTVFSAENKSRPFCSERCQLIDLGAWASENYRVAAETPPDDMGLENFSEFD